MRDAKNQPTESESAGRAGSLAEPQRGTVPDVSHDDIARTRHDEEAARRQELDLDNPQPLDASRNLAERVRATFTAEAEAAEAGAGADAAEADAEAAAAEARHGRAAERDGEKLTPILAALAQLRTKQSERARGPAPRLRPAPNVGRKPPGRGLVGGGRVQERPKPPAPKSPGRGGPAPRF